MNLYSPFLLSLLIGVTLMGCGTPASDRDSTAGVGPVLLFGVDGLEWDVVLPMVAEGRMPVLAGLMERGAFGDLQSFRPTRSPIIWTSIATGTPKEQHGILGFVDPELQKQGEMRLFTSNDRRNKAFWNILSERDLRVHVVGWWLTYPVEEINGVMVAQANTATSLEEVRYEDRIWKGAIHEGMRRQVYPEDREDEFLALLPEVDKELPAILRDTFGELPDTSDPLADRLWSKSMWSFRADEIYRRIALSLLREESDFDVLAVYFGGPDVVGHLFWRYMQPDLYEDRPGDEQIERFGDYVRSYYQRIDTVLGELIDAAPSNANVLIVSDHGMQTAHVDVEYASGLRTRSLNSGGHSSAPPGVLVAAGPDIRPTASRKPLEELSHADLPAAGSVMDVTPTLLALLGIPIGEDMAGRVVAELIAPERLDRHPVQTIATHTPPGWLESREITPTESPDQQERLDQLRSLGYLGD